MDLKYTHPAQYGPIWPPGALLLELLGIEACEDNAHFQVSALPGYVGTLVSSLAPLSSLSTQCPPFQAGSFCLIIHSNQWPRADVTLFLKVNPGTNCITIQSERVKSSYKGEKEAASHSLRTLLWKIPPHLSWELWNHTLQSWHQSFPHADTCPSTSLRLWFNFFLNIIWYQHSVWWKT